MQAWVAVDRAHAPDGTDFVLARRGDEFVIRAAGRVLMSSRQHGSEERMAEVAARTIAGEGAHWLLGGLGLGYTLRAALDRAPARSRITVAELVPAVIRWNRGPLAHLAGRPLDDPRTRVFEGDVRKAIGEGRYDAILLDVDNGPEALSARRNDSLYSGRGIEAARVALKPGGVLVVWSAAHDPAYEKRLSRAGFTVEVVPADARGRAGGPRHVLFVARR